MYNKIMKIIKKDIKECDTKEWVKTLVLDLEYSYKWNTWKILIRDYNDDNYLIILKQLRKEVKTLFDNTIKWV